MSISSKSPRKVALVALAVAKESLPRYAHKYAPKTYTLHQLFACIVLKRFYKTDYRGIHAILLDNPAIQQDLGLVKVPHFTTIQQAHKRLLAARRSHDLLKQTVELGMGRRCNVSLAAADSTGFRSDRESRHYTRRRHKTQGKPRPHSKVRFPKATIMVDVATHLILAVLAGRGPKPDVSELVPLLDQTPSNVSIRHVLLDAGYDSEANHVYARQAHGMITTIPAKAGRPGTGPPKGYYRRLMRGTIRTRKYYGQRWQVETANSMIKRNQGDVVLGHTAWSRTREDGQAHLTPARPRRVRKRDRSAL